MLRLFFCTAVAALGVVRGGRGWDVHFGDVVGGVLSSFLQVFEVLVFLDPFFFFF